MAECINYGTLLGDLDRNMGYGPTEVSNQSASLAKLALDADLEDAFTFRQAAAEADAVSDAMSDAAEKPLTPAQTKEVERVANRLTYASQAAAGIKARTERTQDIVDYAMGTTTGTATAWMNFKNKVYNTFVNARGHLHHWINTFGSMEGIENFRNRVVTTYEAMLGKGTALQQEFDGRRRDFLKRLIPYANQAGMTVEDFAHVVGRYAPALHTEEANAQLVREWNERIDRLEEARYNALERNDQNESAPAVLRITKKLERMKNERDNHVANIDKTMDEITGDRFLNAITTCGYTNEDARQIMQTIVDRTGLSHQIMRELSLDLAAEFDYIYKRRLDAGVVRQSEAEKMPEFKCFVPMLSRVTEEGFSNLTGASNDAVAYNPGTYNGGMKGRKGGGEVDSAYATLAFYGRKAAMELASVDFGEALNAMYERMERDNVKNHGGLRRYEYDRVIQHIHSNNDMLRNLFDGMYRGGGFVANVSDRDPNNPSGMTKYFFVFENTDFEQNGGKWNGRELNRSLSADFHLDNGGPILSALGKATSTMGMLVTRFTPLFAPGAGLRDIMERAGNMANRTYYLEKGGNLGGASVIPRYFSNLPVAGKILYAGIRGNFPDPMGADAQIYNEFKAQGLQMAFTSRGQVNTKSMQELFDPKSRGFLKRLGIDTPRFNRFLNGLGENRDRVLTVIDGWNDYFQNMSGFTQYYTLRKLGVGMEDAAASTRTEMNLGQRGSVAPWLQALAPFVAPTVQSGVAMTRSLGLGKDHVGEIPKASLKGFASLVAAYGAYSMLMPLIDGTLGTDDSGTSRMDSISLDEMTRNLPIGIGPNGEYIRIPLGFGLVQMGATMAVGFDRMQKGLMSPMDVLYEVLYGGLKNASPGNWPEYNPGEDPAAFIMATITPQLFRPMSEIMGNRNMWGSPIYDTNREPSAAKADSGRLTTNRRFHEIAQTLHSLGIDLQPEVYQHLEKSYLTGPFRLLTLLANSVDDVYKGSENPTALQELPPLISALGGTTFFNKAGNATRSLYYGAMSEFQSRIRDQGLKMTGANQAEGETAEDHRRTVLTDAGWSDDDIEDYIALWRASESLKALAQDWNAQWRELWRANDSSAALKSSLEQLSADCDEVYLDVVGRLNYYARSRR